MSEHQANIALLIDADNASPARIEDVLAILAELGTVNIRRAYGNWKKASLKSWETLTHRYAIEPSQQFDFAKGKSATDMKMIIDAMDLLYRGRVGGFGLMSSDSDFTPLAIRLRQDGLPVYGFGEQKTPLSFRQACTRFIEIDQLGEPEAPLAPPPESEGGNPVDPSALAAIAAAWKAQKPDERGFARLSDVGNRAAAATSFDLRSYGYKKMRDLIAATGQFEIEDRDNVVWIKRVR